MNVSVRSVPHINPQETIREFAIRTGMSLGEASRMRSLDTLRRRMQQIEATFGLFILSLIFFGIGVAAACQV